MEAAQVSDNTPVLLQGELWIKWCSRQQLSTVLVTAQCITCTRLNAKDKNSKTSAELNTVVFGFQNIIGCRIVNGSDCKVRLNVFAYPVKKLTPKPLELKVRSLETLMIIFDGRDSREQNQQDAMKWKEIIDSQMIKRFPPSAADAGGTDSSSMLVLVNPSSGAGKAPAIFKDKIRPILEQSGIDYKLIHTERAGHGKEIAKTLDLKEWYGLVVVSGDGLMFELINGLMEREDWEEAIRLPIGLTPGGSGNCISCSVLYSVGESYITDHITQACYVLSKHVVRPMDLTAIDTCTGERLYASCSVNWALIADVDIESEKWRWFGSNRFFIEFLSKIAALKKYKGKVSFLPVDGWDSKDFFKRNKKRGVKVVGDVDRWRTAEEETAEGYKDQSIEKEHSAEMSDEQHLNSKQCSNSNFVETRYGHAESNVDESDMTSDGNVNGAVASGSGATLRDIDELPKLTDPVPSNWLTLEEEFITLSICLVSHMSYDFMSSPTSKLNDGIVFLFMIRSGATRGEIVHIVTTGEAGKHLESARCEMIPIKAFRLEPVTPRGHLVVDGEIVSYGPIQGRVIPGLARVMAM